MKTIKTNFIKTATTILSAIAALGCHQKSMSVTLQNHNAGDNNSFEYSQNGLPVNWQLYTAATVRSGDFDILLDTISPKDGKQSLKFVVRACDSTGGWHSPGIAKQFAAQAGETYRIRLWLKNNGGHFSVNISGISATTSQSEAIIDTAVVLNNWTLLEHTYVIPKKMNGLRFELNVLSKGILWIDDIEIKKM